MNAGTRQRRRQEEQRGSWGTRAQPLLSAALLTYADLRQLRLTLDSERGEVRGQSKHYKLMKLWPLVDIVPPSITHVCLQNRGKC